ncbi:MAG: cytochrome P450 [Myxococcota bacterium]|jgi:cytochrome P450|nr:cytochrome P450 [Myxococcota bacterium]
MTETVSPERIAEIDTALDPLPDLHDLTREMRSEGRLSTVKMFGAPTSLITHYDDVIAAYRDEETFPAPAAYKVIAGPVMGHTIQCMTGREHKLHRALVRSSFKPSIAREFVGTVFANSANSIIDRIADQGSADLVRDFTRHFSFDIICRVIGIHDVDNDQLHHWVSGLFGYPSDPEAAIATTKKFNEYIVGLLDERRREPKDDFLTGLLHAEIEGNKLDDEQILSFIRLLFPAGADTTFHATGSMIYYLLKHPDVLERVRENPADRDKAIEETLRIEPPVTTQPRMNPQDVTWRGLDIPQGFISFGTSAANRDPAFFPDPDRFDIDRKVDHQIATFGNGQHFCVGSHFARGEMRAALDALLERLPGLRLAEGAEPQVLGGTLRGPRELLVEFDA